MFQNTYSEAFGKAVALGGCRQRQGWGAAFANGHWQGILLCNTGRQCQDPHGLAFCHEQFYRYCCFAVVANRFHYFNYSYMKQVHLLCLLLIGSLGQFTYQNVYVDYGGAKEFDKLRIIPIRAKAGLLDSNMNTAVNLYNSALTLQDAMDRDLVEIEDRLGVNTLQFTNNSNQPIYLMSGEIVAGGRQDRIVANDMVLPPNSRRVRVPVYCVEEGRWGNKSKYKYYHEGSMHLRKKVDRERNQGAVWKEIDEENDKDNVRTGTHAYTAHANNRQYVQKENDYLAQFPITAFGDTSNIIGIVAMTGDMVVGCDIFAAPHLFQREYNTIIYSYIDEATSFGIPLTITNQQVRTYMDNLLSNEVSQRRFIERYGKVFEENGRVIHITTYDAR
jgi:hypothetical protein